MGRVAPHRGDQGTATQGSPVGRRSRLVDGDRELRVADHLQVPHSGLARRQRTSLPSKIIPQAWRALEMDSSSKTSFQGWMQEVCWVTLTPPSAAVSTSGQRLRPAASTVLEPTPMLSSAAARDNPLRAPPVSRAPSQPRAAVTESENSARDFFPAPRSVDGILDFSMDPFFLAAFGLYTDFHRDSSTDTFFLLLFRGDMLPKRLLDRARLPLHVHLNIMRVRKLATHMQILPQPDLRAQAIHPSLLHVVLVASQATMP